MDICITDSLCCTPEITQRCQSAILQLKKKRYTGNLMGNTCYCNSSIHPEKAGQNQNKGY